MNSAVRHKKRYLTGIDWVINALNYMTGHAGGRGNSSQIVLENAGRIPPAALRNVLDRAAAALPLLGGRVGRGWNLCPCWKYRVADHPQMPLTVKHAESGDAGEVFDLICRHVNTPFASENEHLKFLLINQSCGRSCLAMHFDHRLLDAFGAEAFLELLAMFGSGCEDEVLGGISLCEPPHLDRWVRRFRGGRNTNRMLARLGWDAADAQPLKNGAGPLNTLFESIHFPPEETRRIKEAMDAGPDFMLTLPSLLACVLKELHDFSKEHAAGRSNYIVPVSLARRKPSEEWEKLFFNHFSFMFFQAPVELVESGHGLAPDLQKQLYEQLKAGTPEDLYHASMLTRIVPLPVMRLICGLPVKKYVASCYFACLKESGFRSEQFLGAGVENLFHMPHVPVPPGRGVFFNFFRDRLNLVVSHIEGLMSGGEAGLLARGIRNQLLDDETA